MTSEFTISPGTQIDVVHPRTPRESVLVDKYTPQLVLSVRRLAYHQ